MTTPDPELWRTVPGWPLYQVSTHGRLRSFHRGKVSILAGGRDRDGYRRAVLVQDDTKKSIRLHHMVLWAFVGPCPEGLVARHADGNLENNRPDNLSWSTQLENIADKVKHGTMPLGEQHHNAKLTAPKVLEIRASVGTHAEVAARFGVGKAAIAAVRARRTWAWL